MNKLTAEVARMDIGHLKSFQANPHVGLSLKEEKYLKALEIALPILEQQERADSSWIEWNGGECPAPDGTIVDLKYRDGRVFERELAGNYLWTHGYYHYLPETAADIIAYRVIENDGRGE